MAVNRRCLPFNLRRSALLRRAAALGGGSSSRRGLAFNRRPPGRSSGVCARTASSEEGRRRRRKMWLPVSTVAAICMLLEAGEGTAADKELELIFKDRSQSEWQEAWHNERYTRCREKLFRHLYWACEKDIYRITKRTEPEMAQNYDMEVFDFPWITEQKARKMLRTRRAARSSRHRSGPSITAECCSSTGCTWEEYAEYCPTNKRYTKFV